MGRGSVAAPRALHPRLRVEPARRVAAAQQIVAGKRHLLAEEVEVVREAEVAAERRARPVARVVRGPRGLRRRWPELVASYELRQQRRRDGALVRRLEEGEQQPALEAIIELSGLCANQ